MRVRHVGLAGLLALVVAYLVVGNTPPTMEDQYVTTVENRAVALEIRAEDADIDPLHPEAHPLRFLLLEGPSHGVLLGDLTDVVYESPHDAVARVTYVPAKGYVGVDLVTLAVFDPLNETASGIVEIRMEVVEQRRAGLLSGRWDAGFGFDVEAGGVSAFRTRITEVYRVGLVTVKGVAGFRMGTPAGGGSKATVFDSLTFEANATVGDVSASSQLSFNPTATSPADLFDYWRTSARVALHGMTFEAMLYVTHPVADSYLTLTGRGSAGGLGITDTVRMDMDEACRLAFAQNDVQVSWSWCELQSRASLRVTSQGFEELSFGLSDLPLPRTAWLPDGIELDLTMAFTPGAKTVTPSLSWRPSWLDCLQVQGELDWAAGANQPATISSISLYALKIQCEVDGVTFQSATSLDPDKNAIVTGQGDYFERVAIGGKTMACCQVPGTWAVATYFGRDSTQLFSWGMTTLRVDVGLLEALSLTLDVVLRSGELGDPTAELSLGWTVRW